MKVSSDRGPLAPKKREFFKLRAAAGISAFAASHAIEASGKYIRPPATTPYLEQLPVHLPKSAAVDVDPPPQEFAHPDEAGRDAHQAWDHSLPQKTYVIEIKVGMHSFHPHLPTQPIWGYDGKFPGPTIVAREGEPIIVRYVNLLPPDANGFGSPEISTHLHNGHATSESDGYAGNYFSRTISGPTLTKPANCFAGYDTFPDTDGDSREGLGTLWYHDHREEFTAAIVYKGLAGFYLMFDKFDSGSEEDPSETALRLPSGIGVHDIPLMISNPEFDGSGRLIFDQFDPDGFIGNKIAINGKISPFFKVARRKYRFRVLNASVSRFYHLCIRHKGGIIQNEGRGPGSGLSVNGIAIMRFNVDSNAVDNSPVPRLLRTLPPIDLASVRQKRHVEFERFNGVWEIDRKLFDVENPTFKVKRGTAEIWTLEGKGSCTTPSIFTSRKAASCRVTASRLRRTRPAARTSSSLNPEKPSGYSYSSAISPANT